MDNQYEVIPKELNNYVLGLKELVSIVNKYEEQKNIEWIDELTIENVNMDDVKRVYSLCVKKIDFLLNNDKRIFEVFDKKIKKNKSFINGIDLLKIYSLADCDDKTKMWNIVYLIAYSVINVIRISSDKRNCDLSSYNYDKLTDLVKNCKYIEKITYNPFNGMLNSNVLPIQNASLTDFNGPDFKNMLMSIINGGDVKLSDLGISESICNFTNEEMIKLKVIIEAISERIMINESSEEIAKLKIIATNISTYAIESIICCVTDNKLNVTKLISFVKTKFSEDELLKHLDEKFIEKIMKKSSCILVDGRIDLTIFKNIDAIDEEMIDKLHGARIPMEYINMVLMLKNTI